MTHLPQGAGVVFTGVAAMDLAARRSVRPKNIPLLQARRVVDVKRPMPTAP